ncbi:TPA: hypothetical protein ACF5ZO_002900, partial [Staphylococcus aureus]
GLFTFTQLYGLYHFLSILVNEIILIKISNKSNIAINIIEYIIFSWTSIDDMLIIINAIAVIIDITLLITLFFISEFWLINLLLFIF